MSYQPAPFQPQPAPKGSSRGWIVVTVVGALFGVAWVVQAFRATDGGEDGPGERLRSAWNALPLSEQADLCALGQASSWGSAAAAWRNEDPGLGSDADYRWFLEDVACD